MIIESPTARNHQVIFETEITTDIADAEILVEPDVVFLVLDQFECAEHADAAHLTYQRVRAQFA